ncbi:MAG: acyl carrier protein [Desulfuromonadaceae bacterium]|nr:acyl carrier protein [Desulfuromonadaceae bacterium]
MDAIKKAIRAYIIDNFMFGDDRGLDDSMSFLENGIIDSTGILEMVTFLEEKFSIKISDEDLLPENLESVEKMGMFVLRMGA